MITFLIGKLGTKIGVIAFAGLLFAFLGASAGAAILYYQKQSLQVQFDAQAVLLEDAKKAVEMCKSDITRTEGIAHDRQDKINALNKSIRANRLRAESARCIPVTR